MTRSTWIFAAGIALVVIVGPIVASPSPDGLEQVAADLAFDDQATTVLEAPLPNYTVAGLPSPLTEAAVGLLGALVVGGAAFGAGWLSTRSR